MRKKTDQNDPRTCIGLRVSTRKRLYELERYGSSMDDLLNEMIDMYISQKQER